MSNIEKHKPLVPIYINNLNDPKLFIGTCGLFLNVTYIKPVILNQHNQNMLNKIMFLWKIIQLH